MTQTEALKLALEALLHAYHEDEAHPKTLDAITAIREALAQPEHELSGLPMVISGAIYDFAGYLTTRDKVIKVGSTANASPIADLVKAWAELRGLSLDDAAVLSWQEWLKHVPTSDTSEKRVDETAKQRHEQEPVAYQDTAEKCHLETVPAKGTLLQAIPSQRKPLTDEEIYEMYNEPRSDAEMIEFARAIEAAHGIKGEA